jgi:hypothetical protein
MYLNFILSNSEYLVVGGWITLKWIFKNLDGEAWTGLLWFWLRAGGSTCECSNDPLHAIKCGEFLN